MSFVEWKVGKTKKFLGTKSQVKGEDGQGLVTEDGTPVMERDNESVTYPYPALRIHTEAEVADALVEILTRGEKGFDSLLALVEHINYGLQKDVARQFNQGVDIRYNARQQAAIKTFRNTVKEGWMSLEEAAVCLAKQGILHPYDALALPPEGS